MNERLEKIRQLLSEIEAEMETGAPGGDRDSAGLELSLVIQAIVDDLHRCSRLTMPRSTGFSSGTRSPTTESLFCESARAISARPWSGRRYSQAKENTISLGEVQETIGALESIGAIRKEGEPNRDGTLYRVAGAE